MMNVVGCDIAINHGALVDYQGRVLHYFTDGNGMISSADQLYDKAMELVGHTPMAADLVVDWDREQGSWSKPKIGMLITMQVSFYGALATALLGCRVHYVTPSLVRYCLGLTDHTSKDDVQAVVRGMYPALEFKDDKHGDKMDAFILAATFDCARSQFSL